MNDERWVAERMRVLDPGEQWYPNAGAALAGLHHRAERRRSWRRGWLWSTAIASACVAVMFVLPAPATCALVGIDCARRATMPVLMAPAAAVKTADSKVNAAAKTGAAAAPSVVAVKYKESGSPAASVTVEIYSDYECPSCAAFYTGVFPQFAAEFVKTGKVRIVHRDFPLPQHPFARLAARYANAAGELGHYDEVVARLFTDQPEWAANGNVDASVAQVLSAETMRKVRALVESDPRLDATVASDLAMVGKDEVNQTPTIVFVYRGIRKKVAGMPSIDLMRSYVEEVLAQ